LRPWDGFNQVLESYAGDPFSNACAKTKMDAASKGNMAAAVAPPKTELTRVVPPVLLIPVRRSNSEEHLVTDAEFMTVDRKSLCGVPS
jgi:hypothetical protein